MTKDAGGIAIFVHFKGPGFPAVVILCQADERVIAVVFKLDHGLCEIFCRQVDHYKLFTPLANRDLPTPGA